MSVPSLLTVLLQAIEEEGNQDDRQRVSVPRPLLGLAAWNLLSPENVGNQSFDRLVRHVTGLSAREVLAIYDQTRSPLLFLARQYNILDYGWAISSRESAVRARLEICVQTPFPHLNGVVFPDQWSRCSLFWAPFEFPQPPGWSKDDSGKQVLTGTLRLPGGVRQGSASVELKVNYQRSGLDSSNEYEIKGAPIGACKGIFKAEKELGKPGATRITHEKEIDFGQPPSDLHKAMLAYWLQAESVCLILPA
jgi:hypothetical protein